MPREIVVEYVGVLEYPPDIRWDLALAITAVEEAVLAWEIVVECILLGRERLRLDCGLPATGALDPWPTGDPVFGA